MVDAIYAYLDESGVHEGAAICLVAGFFGEHGDWQKCAESWLKAFSDFSVPKEEFHAKDLAKERPTGFFYGWDKEKQQNLIDALVAAIVGTQLAAINFGILTPDFLSFSEVQRRFFTGATITPYGKLVGTGSPAKPYFTPFLHVLREVAGYVPAGGRAHFFCGLDRPFAGYALAAYQELTGGLAINGRDRLGEISFPKASETPELQTADLFVHMSYLRALKCLESNNWHLPADPPLDSLVRRARNLKDLVFYNKTTLGAIWEQLASTIFLP